MSKKDWVVVRNEAGELFRMRIRRLTPKECFRLMDVPDESIDKIQEAGISKTQQYKIAGNSIVTRCMTGIFKNLFVTNGKKYKNGQLELF